MTYYTPPSMTNISVIRSRARINSDPQKLYASIRSVRDLDQDEYCDPHDPCCAHQDPEIFVDKTILKEAGKIRKECAPRNPLHFEYTILHRQKLRRLFQMAAERQNNEELTEAELQEIKRLEDQDDLTSKLFEGGATTTRVAKNDSPLSKNPETGPPQPEKPVLIDAEQLQNSLQGLTNMALAHEIALNKDFKLKKPLRSSDVTEEQQLSPQVQIALDIKDKYWRKIDDILYKKNYKQWKHVMIDLLATLKSTLIGTIPPHNLSLRENVQIEMDLKKIGRLIDSEKFNFLQYIDFILDTVAALCCPIRDKEIIEIRDIPVLSERVRKTLELMEDVNLEAANFVLSQSRQHIIQNCVIFERNSFANYIEFQYKEGYDPIRVTREWIRRHSLPDRHYNEAMSHAFCEIFDWQETAEWPETLALDWNRFIPIRQEITRVSMLAVMVQAVHDYVEKILSQYKEKAENPFESEQIAVLKDHRLLSVLREELDQVFTIQFIQDPEKYELGLENCGDYAASVVNQHSIAEYCQQIGEAEKDEIRQIIRSMTNLNCPQRLEFLDKIKEWFRELAKGEGKTKIHTPNNLRFIGALVIVPVTEMIRLMMYNRSVFDVLYLEIFDGNCPPPSIYPPAPKRKEEGEEEEGTKVVLDANKYGQVEDDAGNMDETIVRIVGKLRKFKARTMVYRRSKIDPRTKPMYEADGTPIVPPEKQAEYTAVEMTPLEQKHYDEYLLRTEPTLDEDYEGVYAFGNVGEPDWMFGYTTEQLLQLMERENMVNANKLRRIKERLQQETLNERIAENLPVFYKIWGKDEGTLQKEYCRLQRIIEKGPTPVPPNATDEPSGKREFHKTCEEDTPPPTDSSDVTEKGEKIITSRNGGKAFWAYLQDEVEPQPEEIEEISMGVGQGEIDMDNIARALEEVPEGDQDDLNQFYYHNDTDIPETALEKLIRSVSKQEPTLDVLGLKCHVPRKSLKPVWNRILGVHRGRLNQARQQYSSMLSIARQIEERQPPLLVLPRVPPPPKPVDIRTRGTSVRTVLDMELPNLMGKNVMISKSSGPKMPATSDLPTLSAYTSSTLRTKRALSVTRRLSHSAVKFASAPTVRRPHPPGQMRRAFRDVNNTVNFTGCGH